MPPRHLVHLIGLCLVMVLAACNRTPTPARATASTPEGAVRQLAQHLHDNDLAAYARAAVPPATHAQLETAWREDRSRWPLTELPLDDQLQPMLAALAAPEAERTLQQGFKRNFANQDKDLKEAARSLGLFGVQYVKREGAYTDQEREHYAQVIEALAEWAAQAPLGEPKRGATAIPRLTAAARKTGLATDQAFHDAGMDGSLQRLSPFFATTKAVLGDYGLPLDQSSAGLATELLERKGDQARVRITYPLGKRTITTVVDLQRVGGRWYLSDTLRHAQEALSSIDEVAPPSQVVDPAKEPSTDPPTR
jgi:hypothetical protein